MIGFDMYCNTSHPYVLCYHISVVETRPNGTRETCQRHVSTTKETPQRGVSTHIFHYLFAPEYAMARTVSQSVADTGDFP